MKEFMDNETLKRLHCTEIEILDEFVRICESNNLIYFLIGGTALGAVRHKGFIPWDDDLDVAMPRNDYERFLNIASNQLNSKYMIDNKNTNKKYYLNFTKIRKIDTIFEQDFQINYNGPKGIWIDIFPIDETNGDNLLIKIQNIINNFIFRILHYKNGFILKKKYVLLKKFIGKLFFIKNSKLLNIQDRILKLQNNKNFDYFVNLASTYNYKKELFLKTDFLPVKKLTFEGKAYCVPNNYDKYLKQVYGNYMELPPENERYTHNPVRLLF